MVVRTAVWAFMHVLQKRFEYVALQRQLMMGKNATANGLTPAPTPHVELTPLMRGAWIVSLALCFLLIHCPHMQYVIANGLLPARSRHIKAAPLMRGLWMRCGSALVAPDILKLVHACMHGLCLLRLGLPCQRGMLEFADCLPC